MQSNKHWACCAANDDESLITVKVLNRERAREWGEMGGGGGGEDGCWGERERERGPEGEVGGGTREGWRVVEGRERERERAEGDTGWGWGWRMGGREVEGESMEGRREGVERGPAEREREREREPGQSPGKIYRGAGGVGEWGWGWDPQLARTV